MGIYIKVKHAIDGYLQSMRWTNINMWHALDVSPSMIYVRLIGAKVASKGYVCVYFSLDMSTYLNVPPLCSSRVVDANIEMKKTVTDFPGIYNKTGLTFYFAKAFLYF